MYTSISCASLLLTLAAVATSAHLLERPPHEHGGLREHECIHDTPRFQEMLAQDLARNAHFQQAEAHVQGHQFAAQAPESIRFVVSTADLDDSTKFCSAVGQTRPDMAGGTLVCAQENILTQAKKDLLGQHRASCRLCSAVQPSEGDPDGVQPRRQPQRVSAVHNPSKPHNHRRPERRLRPLRRCSAHHRRDHCVVRALRAACVERPAYRRPC
jgi:hypothetical protein